MHARDSVHDAEAHSSINPLADTGTPVLSLFEGLSCICGERPVHEDRMS